MSPLDVLRATQGELEAAQRLHAQATDARAAAVYRARLAGASLRQIGAVLGMAHNNALKLERRGAELAGMYQPPVLRGPEVVAAAADTPALEPVVPEVPCLRSGCGQARAEGKRFCLAHLWA